MIKCIAIDDEPLALDLIKKMCQDIPFVCLDKVFTQASLAKRYLCRNSCDLIFLDIQMPDVNGVDFFKSLDQQPEVIFTTAFADYAVQGFEVKAVDYLLKPFSAKRFREACDRVHAIFEGQNIQEMENRSLYVRSDYSLVRIAYSDILYMETMDDYIKIHLVEAKPILTLMSMKEMLQKLPKVFIRIHRSYIVRLDRVQRVKMNKAQLTSIALPIGSTYRKEFITKYTGE